MPRRSILIRNITTISFQEIDALMMQLTGNLPPKLDELKRLSKISKPNTNERINIQNLIKDPEVRDYLYEAILNQTGSHIILHHDGIDDMGRGVTENFDYILQKLLRIPQNETFDLIYLGGGHGDPQIGMNALSLSQIKNICLVLQQNGNSAKSIVLGSCFSAAYFSHFQPLLNDHGLMLGHALECGGENHFIQSFNWMTGKRNRFYSVEDIKSAIKARADVQSDFKGVLQGEIDGHNKIDTQYNNLLNHYQGVARSLLANEELSDAELYEITWSLFNEDLNNFLSDIQKLLPNISDKDFQKILTNYPAINKCINEISTNLGLFNIYDAIKNMLWLTPTSGFFYIYDALRNTLKPAPTSLVIATKNKISMLDVRKPGNKPPNASEQYRHDFDLVLKSNLPSFNIELDTKWDAISVREAFNEKFELLFPTQESLFIKANLHLNLFVLPDIAGDNYVTGIEEYNGGYKIVGANHSGQERGIIIDEKGNPTSLHGSENLGAVGSQMFAHRNAIIEHFNFKVPTPKTQQIEFSTSTLGLEPYVLKDSQGDNYVTSVELYNGGYKILGFNNEKKVRGIIIDEKGDPKGLDGSERLGMVGTQMFFNLKEILQYFSVPEKVTAPPTENVAFFSHPKIVPSPNNTTSYNCTVM